LQKKLDEIRRRQADQYSAKAVSEAFLAMARLATDDVAEKSVEACSIMARATREPER
jgi:hypothetical protein